MSFDIWPYMDDKELRVYMAKVIVRCEGNLKKVAWELGINSRDKLYRKIYALKLWNVVNKVREERNRKARRYREGKMY